MAHLRWHTSDGTPQIAHLRWHTSDGTPQNYFTLLFKYSVVRDLCPPGTLRCVTSYFGKGLIYVVAEAGRRLILRTLISQTLVSADGARRFCTRLYKTETPKCAAVCDLDL